MIPIPYTLGHILTPGWQEYSRGVPIHSPFSVSLNSTTDFLLHGTNPIGVPASHNVFNDLENMYVNSELITSITNILLQDTPDNVKELQLKLLSEAADEN